ncbi:MAG: hydantoinase/oxoprolinase family protein [Xanthobacteraceae bacterium]
MPPYRLGVDVGGTHTDLVLTDATTGEFRIAKVASTPADPAVAVMTGIASLLDAQSASAIEYFAHGTTVTTNALLQLKGARVGLLVNAGFRGIQEVQSQAREGNSFDYMYRRPTALVTQRLTREVPGRIDANGRELEPIDLATARRAVADLLALGVESFAVCYLFSFLNPTHERATADIIRALAPSASLSLSSVVLPRLREWPRLSTTLVNAYLEPVLTSYVASLAEKLDGAGINTRQRFIMQSNGGVLPFAGVASGGATVHTLLSGPAAGVCGSAYLIGKRQGWKNLITFDMGGTSCDIAFVQDGMPLEASDTTVCRYTVDVPALEIATITAGGGTIARLDRAGFLNVGPESAGADPGPACYGKGGVAPTVTDADLMCGYLDPDYFLGGSQALDVGAAERALQTLAGPMGVTPVGAALGIIRLINGRMADEVRVQAAKRAVNLGSFVLVPFGGAGPLHAAAVAAELGITRVLVPPNPGAFSALGLLCTDVVHDYIRSSLTPLTELVPNAVNGIFLDLEVRARADLGGEGLDQPAMIERSLDLRYTGQGYELPVAIGNGPISEHDLAGAAARFHSEHKALHGHSAPDQPVELMSYRVRARVPVPKFEFSPVRDESGPAGQGPIKTAQIRLADGSSVQVPIYARDNLRPGDELAGPLIVQQLDATTLLPPGWTARVDRYRNLILEARGA